MIKEITNNLTLASGMGSEPNTITFYSKETVTEMLKLCENGDIFVHGRLADTDMEIVNALRDFLNEWETKDIN